MNTYFRTIFSVIILVAATSFTKPTQSGQLKINFTHYVNNEILKLDEGHYKNELGQPYTISKFKYYIGQIHLLKAGGKYFDMPDYYMINEDEPTSKQIALSEIPDGEYTGISFTLGVDSTSNCSGAQSGALDPVNGMFWAWNTGYIFMKLEGNSPLSTMPEHLFEFHIGGYRQPTNSIRTIRLDFKKPLKITRGKTSTLELKTDIAEILKSPNSIDFSKTASITDFHNAALIADNYTDMFSVLTTGE